MAQSIFITGASSGLGEALAARLRQSGAAAVLPLALDVTDFPSIDGALERAAREFGRLDIVVVNAGADSAAKSGLHRLWPWVLLAPLMKRLPARLLAPPPRRK